MAGDWIKMRVDLRDDPDVIGIAASVGLEEDTVVGKLHRVWSWADQHTVNGNAPRVTSAWLDRYVGVDGFADAMAEVGWLEIGDGGITFSEFEKHNGQTGKRRALSAKRTAIHRNRNGTRNGASVTESVPREEKRREEQEETPSESCSEPEAPASERSGSMEFPVVGGSRKAWTLTPAKLAEYREAFPGVDVDHEVAMARQWCRDNPTRRKTARGMPAFLFRWLEKCQNHNRGSPSPASAVHPDVSFRLPGEEEPA